MPLLPLWASVACYRVNYILLYYVTLLCYVATYKIKLTPALLKTK
jgi:hypothetical protein